MTVLPGKFQPVVSPWVTIILTFERLNFEGFMPSEDKMKQREFSPVCEPFPPLCQHRLCSNFHLSLVQICCTAHQIWMHANQLYCCICYSTIHPKVWHNSNLSQGSSYPTHPGLLPRETHIPETESRSLLDIVIRESVVVLELLASLSETLLVRMGTLTLDFRVSCVWAVNFDKSSFTCEGLDEESSKICRLEVQCQLPPNVVDS
jgi:hypothetical protein